MTTWFALTLLAPVYSGDSDCKQAIAKASNEVHLVKRAVCAPIDPACAELAGTARSIGDIQKSAIDRAVASGQNRCSTYDELLKGGKTPEAAWTAAMHGCSPSIDKIPPAYFPCILELDKKALKPTSPAETPGFIPPMRSHKAADEKMK
ncbi:MAG: hypothetical protein HY074_17830 [Deltaproteobacteria bacterium]|nr:hypothetical protein [Deltaproteobacteria bacterium]